MKRISVRVPVRVDLAGGTLDLWPLYLFHQGAKTVNVAISLHAECDVEETGKSSIEVVLSDVGYQKRYASVDEMLGDEHVALIARAVEHFKVSGVRIVTRTEAPRGSGLGGSSALAIALVRALSEYRETPLDGEELIFLVRDLETRLLGLPAGIQDYYPAVFGGLNALHLNPGRITRESIAGAMHALGAHLVVHYTGVSHFSGTNNWEIYKRHVDGDRSVREGLDRIAEAADAMVRALTASDMAAAGAALASEWESRKSLIEGVSNHEIDRAIERAIAAGAWGGKVCGAGGGGCVVFLCPAERREEVIAALATVAGRTLDVSPVTYGPSVTRTDEPPQSAPSARRGRARVEGEPIEELYVVSDEEGEYKPFLLAQGSISYNEPRSGFYAKFTKSLIAPIDLHSQRVDWQASRQIDPDSLRLSAVADTERSIASAGLESFLSATEDAESDFRQYLCESERLPLLYNGSFSLYSQLNESRDEFVARCVEEANRAMEKDADRLESTFRRRIDQMRERSERERRETADANEGGDPDMKTGDFAIQWGQTLYNITAGRKAVTDEPQSVHEADYMAKITQLQKIWDRELDVRREELMANARDVEELVLTPSARDIEMTRYVVVWAPRI